MLMFTAEFTKDIFPSSHNEHSPTSALQYGSVGTPVIMTLWINYPSENCLMMIQSVIVMIFWDEWPFRWITIYVLEWTLCGLMIFQNFDLNPLIQCTILYDTSTNSRFKKLSPIKQTLECCQHYSTTCTCTNNSQQGNREKL